MSSSRRLPNFSALRAFEAAARHENFSRAAEELHLTHGAISHQVRALEEELGRPLFVRHGRQVKITSDALRFAQFLGRSFAEIATATDAMRAAEADRRLTVSTLPWFAARWLAPRLGRFIDLHPEIEVVLQAGRPSPDLARDGIDVGIHLGPDHQLGTLVERLMGDLEYPVVSPHYRASAVPARLGDLRQGDFQPRDLQLSDLPRQTLLRSAAAPWTPWLRAAGLDLAEPSEGIVYEEVSRLIRAAVDGEGVALVRHVAVMQEIASGQLVRLFDVATPSPDEYYFVAPPASAGKPQVVAFRRWLLEEVATFQRQQG